MALRFVKQVPTGTNISVGKAAIEMGLQDSLIGKRLAAAVDERAGQNIPVNLTSSRSIMRLKMLLTTGLKNSGND